jgi:type IV fimbrial biogenesis protein FimT
MKSLRYSAIPLVAPKYQRIHKVCSVSAKEKGYSLVELLLAISIVGILASMALPSMENLLLKFQEKSLLSSLANSMRIARSEAIKRNGGVVICKSTDGQACASDGGWEHGWLDFHDMYALQRTEQLAQNRSQ